MKILMTTDTVGGVWSYAMDLAAELLKRQVKVAVAAMGPKLEPHQEREKNHLEKKGLAFYHQTYHLEWMDEGKFDPRPSRKWLKGIALSEHPDLIHFNSFGQVDADWEIPTVLVLHSCVVTWWKAIYDTAPPKNWIGYFQLVKGALEKADEVVAPTREHLDQSLKAYQVNRPARAIHNGCRRPNEDRIPLRKQPFIFCAGRTWDQAKNIDLLINAAPFIHGEIVVAGSGDRSGPLPENVNILGRIGREQLMNWLRISSVYVLPVRYEPFGLSLLEAAQHHCALVGGDIGTLREIWENQIHYVRPFDEEGLIDTCNELLLRPDFCAEWGKRAHDRGITYSLEKMAANYLNLYRQACHKKKVA